MPIHHALIKKAAKHKIELSELPDEDAHCRFRAYSKNYDFVLFGRDGKQVLDEVVTLGHYREKFESFDMKVEDDDTVTIKVRGTGIEVRGMRAIAATKKAEELWAESRQSLDIDDDEADEELQNEISEEHEKEDTVPGSVVNEKYRARYAELGHPNNCGDWLRQTIDNIVSNKEGFNLELFETICNANGVDMSKYKRESKGDRGRFSMTGRNKLSPIVWLNGELKMPETINGGESFRAPQEWRDDVKARFNYKKPAAPVAKTPVKVT